MTPTHWLSVTGMDHPFLRIIAHFQLWFHDISCEKLLSFKTEHRTTFCIFSKIEENLTD